MGSRSYKGVSPELNTMIVLYLLSSSAILCPDLCTRGIWWSCCELITAGRIAHYQLDFMVIIVMRVMTAGGDDDPTTMPVRFLRGRRRLREITLFL